MATFKCYYRSISETTNVYPGSNRESDLVSFCKANISGEVMCENWI